MDYTISKIEEHMRFICPECGAELPTQVNWRRHLNSSHDYNKKTVAVFNFKEINERYHECNECHKWVANGKQSITTLQYHRISHLPFNLTFKCRHCVKAFARKRALCDHLITEHTKLVGHNQYITPNEYCSASSSAKPASNVNLDELVITDMESKKDPADLIQKALLDSLIDLENETLAEFTPNSDNANEYALNQSLNELEAILKGDFVLRENTQEVSYLQQPQTQQQQTQTPQQHQPQFYTEVVTNELVDYDDNELLEQICADIFEEVVEFVQHEAQDTKLQQTYDGAAINDDFAAVSDHNATHNTEPEEKIISIEINAVDESDRNEMYGSPKRKRLKLDDSATSESHQHSTAKSKAMLDAYILYLCPECGREFKTQSLWRDHVFRVHDLTNTMFAKFKRIGNGTSHKCLDCMQILNTTKTHELQRHRFTHMPFQSYLKCKLCNKTKSSKPKIIQHLNDFHAKLLRSYGSHKGSTSTAPTSTFSVSKHGSHAHLCETCGKTFQTRMRLQAHRPNCTTKTKQHNARNSNDSNISNNLSLIAHLKKMRVRMRSLLNTGGNTAVLI